MHLKSLVFYSQRTRQAITVSLSSDSTDEQPLFHVVIQPLAGEDQHSRILQNLSLGATAQFLADTEVGEKTTATHITRKKYIEYLTILYRV